MAASYYRLAGRATRVMRQEGTVMVTLKINGTARTVDVPPDMPLLWVLRDVIGLTGTKFGCGVALRGPCTVHLDGRPIRCWVTPGSAGTGKGVTTLEAIRGPPSGERVRPG